MGLFDKFKKDENEETSATNSFDGVYKAYLKGKVVAMKDVDDPTFAQEILGPGVAIEPTEGILYAPCNGTVTIYDTLHAATIESEDGAQIILHIGIDTVELGGEGFTAHVESDSKIKTGDKLISFDIDAIKGKGYKLTTPIIVCNHDDFGTIETIAEGEVEVGDDLLNVQK